IVAIQKSRAVTNSRGSKRAARQIDHETRAERVTLIVIEQKEILGRREVSQSAGDRALAFNLLPRISQMKSAPAKQERGPRRNFEGSNARSGNSQGKENIRIAQRVVIEEILCTGTEVV